MLWKRFEIKSDQRRACYLKPHRNGSSIPTGGGEAQGAPPTLARVNGTRVVLTWVQWLQLH